VLVESWEQCKDAEVLLESPSAMAGVHIAEALRELNPDRLSTLLIRFALRYSVLPDLHYAVDKVLSKVAVCHLEY
jgi:hypothetical protein